MEFTLSLIILNFDCPTLLMTRKGRDSIVGLLSKKNLMQFGSVMPKPLFSQSMMDSTSFLQLVISRTGSISWIGLAGNHKHDFSVGRAQDQGII
jgi:hypothetical protein